jgi:hypothetical protein
LKHSFLVAVQAAVLVDTTGLAVLVAVAVAVAVVAKLQLKQ